MLTCKVCKEKTTLDELECHSDVEPVSINDYVFCPNCIKKGIESKEFTSNQGNVEF